MAGETLEGLIEIDAAVVAGDSGGPLLDDEGEVIGIHTVGSDGRPERQDTITTIGGSALTSAEQVPTLLAGRDPDDLRCCDSSDADHTTDVTLTPNPVA